MTFAPKIGRAEAGFGIYFSHDAFRLNNDHSLGKLYVHDHTIGFKRPELNNYPKNPLSF